MHEDLFINNSRLHNKMLDFCAARVDYHVFCLKSQNITFKIPFILLRARNMPNAPKESKMHFVIQTCTNDVKDYET